MLAPPVHGGVRTIEARNTHCRSPDVYSRRDFNGGANGQGRTGIGHDTDARGELYSHTCPFRHLNAGTSGDSRIYTASSSCC
jgi:hypothetical protein